MSRGYSRLKKQVVASKQGVSMHLFAQGWKRKPDGTLHVAAIALSPCTNGMAGWQMHVGHYDPGLGQSVQQAEWRFLLASGSLFSVLNPYAISEIATWEDCQATDLKTLLQNIDVKLKAVVEHLA